MCRMVDYGLVSIIVPVYNCEKYIERCVLSVLSQTYKNIELIIINDGSTDLTGRVLDKISDERLIRIDKNNEGISKSRNRGLLECHGQYITYVDADDYIEPDMVEKLVSVLIKNEADISIAYEFGRKNLDNTTEVINASEYSFQAKYSSLVCWGSLFRREIVDGLSFDEDICVSEDILYKCKAISRAQKIVSLYSPLYHYIVYDNSACHGEFSEKKMTEIEAWRRIVKIFSGTQIEKSSKLVLLSRCRYVISMYYSNKLFKKAYLGECIDTYRRNFWDVFDVPAMTSKIKALLFCVFPYQYLYIKNRFKRHD